MTDLKKKKTMTRNNMKWAAMPIAALCLTLAGCSSDDAVETPTATSPLTISASLGADNATSGTRAGIKPGNTDQSKEVFIWHTGDTFAAWLTNAAGTEFETPTGTNPLPVFAIENYSDASPSGSASFTCSNFPADRGYKIVAVYPTDKVFSRRTPTLLQCKISAATFSQAEINSTSHLAADMAMCATATVQAGATSANLTFRHLTSLFRFTLKNENASTCQITQIKVSSDAAIFPYAWLLDLKLDGNLGGSSTASPDLILKFGQEIDGRLTGFNLAAGASFDSYALSGPSTKVLLTDKTLTFTITVKDADGTNEREYTSKTLDANEIIKKNGGATTWEAGKRYWFDLTLKDQLTVTLNTITAMPGWDNETDL